MYSILWGRRQDLLRRSHRFPAARPRASDSGLNVVNTLPDRSRRICDRVNFGVKRFERKRPCIALGSQPPDLADIVEKVVLIDQNAMRVAQIGNGDPTVGYAGNMHEPGHLRIGCGFAGEVVMERIVHQSEGTFSSDRLDRLDSLCL
jgi:hypothetical protein